jgi:hypothetical protein
MIKILENPSEISSELIPFTRSHVVYFLMQGDYVAYIGQTTHLAARIAQHVVDGKQFDKVASFGVESKLALIIEAMNIQYHNPELNKDNPTTVQIEKMKQRLKDRGTLI